MLAKVGEMVLPAIKRQGPIEAWIIDDTGFQRRAPFGRRVATILRATRQAGELPGGGIASLANHHASLPVAYRLYLPEERASDLNAGEGRGPRGDRFQDQARDRVRSDPRRGKPVCLRLVLMDAGYGAIASCAPGSGRFVDYVAGISRHTTVWAPGRDRCRRRNAGRGHRPSVCAAMPSIGRFRSRTWLSASPRPGVASPGARGRLRRCDRASLACAFVPRIEITQLKAGRKSGC